MATNLKTKMFFIFLSLSSFAVNAQKVYTAVGAGTIGFAGDGGQAKLALISTPLRVHLDNVGNIYIPDIGNNRVRKINAAGIINTIAGNGTSVRSGDGGPAISAGLSEPIDVITDNAGNTYVLDNLSIRKINSSGVITTIAGGDTAGYSGDGGFAILASFRTPFGITLDKNGNLYVADMGNNVIRKIDKTGIITTVAGTGVSGYNGDGGPATAAQLSGPTHMRVDAGGNMYIVDKYNNVIRKVNTAGIISTVVGNGAAIDSGDGGFATAAALAGPNDVEVDDSGNIYVVDDGALVRKVNTKGMISTVAGMNGGGLNEDNIAADSVKFNEPRGLAIGKSGDIYIADAFDFRIRVVANSPLTIKNINSTPGILVYPNPVRDVLTVVLKGDIGTLSITNTLGQQVYSRVYSGTGTAVVNVKDLPSGIYFLRVNNMYVQKLLKE